MSWCYKIFTIILLAITAITAVLLLMSMRKIYVTIKTHYSRWKPNYCFIALQVIAFTAPVLTGLLMIVFYKPQISFSNTLTYQEMLMFCLLQVSISVVLLILLYVVTAYSLTNQSVRETTSRTGSQTRDQMSSVVNPNESTISAQSQPLFATKSKLD